MTKSKSSKKSKSKKSSTKPTPKPEKKPMTDKTAETAMNTATDTDTGTETSTDAATDTDTGTETSTNAGTDTDTGTETSTDAGTGTDTGTETSTDAGMGTDTGTETSTDAGTDTATGSETSTDAATGTGASTAGSQAGEPARAPRVMKPRAPLEVRVLEKAAMAQKLIEEILKVLKDRGGSEEMVVSTHSMANLVKGWQTNIQDMVKAGWKPIEPTVKPPVVPGCRVQIVGDAGNVYQYIKATDLVAGQMIQVGRMSQFMVTSESTKVSYGYVPRRFLERTDAPILELVDSGDAGDDESENETQQGDGGNEAQQA